MLSCGPRPAQVLAHGAGSRHVDMLAVIRRLGDLLLARPGVSSLALDFHLRYFGVTHTGGAYFGHRDHSDRPS